MRRASATTLRMVRKMTSDTSRLIAARLMVSTSRVRYMPLCATEAGCITRSAQGVSLSQV